jgi:hypothetical protein
MNSFFSFLNLLMSGTIIATFAAMGPALLFKGRAVRDWLVRLYSNDQITDHLTSRGYLVSMRLVGAGVVAIELWILARSIALVAHW